MFFSVCRFWGKVLVVALVIAMSAGRVLSASPVEGLTQQTLATGLTVVLVEDHWHPIAALEVCYRIGSRSDPYGKQGLAHLLEHLTFPSPAFRHEGDTKPTALLGRAGATTNHDTTCYSQRLLSAEIERALVVEAERMATLRVGPEDLEREKAIVIKERRQLVEGDTWRNVLEEVDSAAFRLHPYRFPTSGWPETLEHITLDDVQRHFAAYYSPANAVLVAVGDFHSQELLAFIEAHFGKIPARPLSAPSAVVEPAQGGERRLLFAPLAAPRLVAAYHVPAFGTPDHAALTVLSAILAGGENTRLPALLYPPHLAEDVGIEYNPLNRDSDLFYIKVALGSRVDFRLTGEAIDDVLWHLREDGLHSGELAQAKKHLLLDLFLEQSSIGARVRRLAQYGALSALPQAQHYTDDIRAVTEADVQRVVSTYFSPENRVVGITGVAHQEGVRQHKEEHTR
jgi:zinc protease